MLRISLVGILDSVYQILTVNEAPFLSVDPGLDINDFPTDAFEKSFELGYAGHISFFVLLSVWWLVYRKLHKEPYTFLSESPEAGVTKGSTEIFCSAQEDEGPRVCDFPPCKAVPKCPPRGKAKAKPPPPPKGTPPRKAPSKAEAKATNPFGPRRVRWRALRSAEGTIFDGLGTGQLKNETAMMLDEVLKTSQGLAKSSPFIPKSSGVCLLDRNRAQQLAILFRRSPLPLQQLCAALLTLDVSIPLGEEEIDGLLQAWPTALDFQLVEEYTGAKEKLRDVEQCIKQISAIPRSESRLKLLRLSSFLVLNSSVLYLDFLFLLNSWWPFLTPGSGRITGWP